MKSHKQVTPNLSVKKYTYSLPGHRIASFPLPERDQSKMLVYDGSTIRDDVFGAIHKYLARDALVVFNKTKVIQARLAFYKTTGARIEILCLHPVYPSGNVNVALRYPSPARWCCLVGNAKKWKSGALEITDPDSRFFLSATLGERAGEGYLVDFRWDPPDMAFSEVLEMVGNTPLPPYITRDVVLDDKRTYQTVFARDEGSVAAPTAGLHFTPAVFDNLSKKGIKSGYLTLHVGAGTFKPVGSDDISLHLMHEEEFVADRRLIGQLLAHQGRVTAVGTTTLRTLESLYWIGVQCVEHGNLPGDEPFLDQWEPYGERSSLPSRGKAMLALLDWMDRHNMEAIHGKTALIIVPGYTFCMTDILITNFHQPGSTLLLLVAAFVGDQWEKVYDHALENGYRFLSYGDSCLLFRE